MYCYSLCDDHSTKYQMYFLWEILLRQLSKLLNNCQYLAIRWTQENGVFALAQRFPTVPYVSYVCLEEVESSSVTFFWFFSTLIFPTGVSLSAGRSHLLGLHSGHRGARLELHKHGRPSRLGSLILVAIRSGECVAIHCTKLGNLS